MKNFSIIAAADQKLGIGINNRLPWNLKADLKHFSTITIGNKNNAVIMGLNTWKSLPEKFRPLKERLNVVLSKEKLLDLPAEVLNFQSLDEALNALERKNVDNVFIIGGAMLYAAAITHPSCQTIYLTEIEGVFKCDTFFPAIPSEFKKIETGELNEENGIKFRFCVYQK
ncbi:MAG: dihydrofolate reductase [Candidatus Komeilibacteria bacterium]|nr:dihydrofolate reductase [Candidatus Komeilibacteria bacterium]